MVRNAATSRLLWARKIQVSSVCRRRIDVKAASGIMHKVGTSRMDCASMSRSRFPVHLVREQNLHHRDKYWLGNILEHSEGSRYGWSRSSGFHGNMRAEFASSAGHCPGTVINAGRQSISCRQPKFLLSPELHSHSQSNGAEHYLRLHLAKICDRVRRTMLVRSEGKRDARSVHPPSSLWMSSPARIRYFELTEVDQVAYMIPIDIHIWLVPSRRLSGSHLGTPFGQKFFPNFVLAAWTLAHLLPVDLRKSARLSENTGRC
ncbi:hypothetical protein AC579_7064 [Pseudocercospora musae]|uniref:Uncharacterized protein n=1 Tax=Pseudocercospora musae TaxID=113226 RepID=A0A139I1K5_9PEZI|nr:hypothetical protein AC579_7064 [Pseudocercospora musae]